jgi:segregation and condensation protein A
MSAAAAGYQVELDVFEGPLDLLLHLVRKHELDIFDIPISFITERYLAYLDLMKGLNLDVAGEYLLMAATLAYIKSRELLPTPDPSDDLGEDGEEEDVDPRQDLIRRLLEYQKYKQVSHQLAGRPIVGRNVWTRGIPREEALAEDIDPDVLAPLADFPVFKLLEAFNGVLEQARIKIAHKVNVDRLSVSDRINELADRLEGEGSFSFRSCFSFLVKDIEVEAEVVRHEAVVTFLALLEMAKLGLIRMSQPPQDVPGEDDIYISATTDNLVERVATSAADDYR